MRDVGLIVLLSPLLAWPDNHGEHLADGYPSIGRYDYCGIYGWCMVPVVDMEDTFQDAEARDASLLAEVRSGIEDIFIMEQGLVNAESSFCLLYTSPSPRDS